MVFLHFVTKQVSLSLSQPNPWPEHFGLPLWVWTVIFLIGWVDIMSWASWSVMATDVLLLPLVVCARVWCISVGCALPHASLRHLPLDWHLLSVWPLQRQLKHKLVFLTYSSRWVTGNFPNLKQDPMAWSLLQSAHVVRGLFASVAAWWVKVAFESDQ